MEAPSEISLELCYPSPRARPVDAKAVNALAASIEESGLLNPVTVRRVQRSRSGQMCEVFEIIAGLHRVKAFRKLQRDTIPAIILDVDDLHAELLLIDENLCRNDLTPAERASAQARRKAIYQQLHPETRAGAGTGGHAGRTKDDLANLAKSTAAPRFDEAAAEATGQSERSIRRDVTRGEALGDDVLAKVARTSLDKGEELDALAKLAPETRTELIERAAAGETVSAKSEAKKQVRANREVVLAALQSALPSKKYGVIYADPEWRFEVYSRDTGMDRAADNHYPTSATDEICARPVGDIAAQDCVLFLWATVPMLPDALRVMDAWGFEYKSHCVWTKDKIGTGYWFRNSHELLLVGTRGNVPAPAMGTQWASTIEGRVTKHSAKPERFYELIEEYFPNLPKIELNARNARKGWDSWGNEAPTDATGTPVYHDPDTGEVIEESPATDSEPPLPSLQTEKDVGQDNMVAPQPRGTPSHEAPGAAGRASDDDQLDIPPFLRRGVDNQLADPGAVPE